MSKYVGHETGTTRIHRCGEGSWVTRKAVCRCEHGTEMIYDVCILPLFGIKVEKTNSSDKVTLKFTMDWLLLFLKGKRCVFVELKDYYISYIL